MVDDQMAIRHGDPDGAGRKGFSVDGVSRRQRSISVEDARQNAWRPAGQVQHHEDRIRQTGRQTGGEIFQCLDSTGRRPDRDDVWGGVWN
jgi:hypothetical protein